MTATIPPGLSAKALKAWFRALPPEGKRAAGPGFNARLAEFAPKSPASAAAAEPDLGPDGRVCHLCGHERFPYSAGCSCRKLAWTHLCPLWGVTAGSVVMVRGEFYRKETVSVLVNIDTGAVVDLESGWHWERRDIAPDNWVNDLRYRPPVAAEDIDLLGAS